MTTMLDKVAQAIADAEGLSMSGAFYPTGTKLMKDNPDRYREYARAALQAIRDAAQTDEGHKLLNDALDWDRNADQDMTAMIGAILEEKLE